MTILCANGCHVYHVGSLRCQCGQAANGYSPTLRPGSGQASATIFQGYHPVGYRQANPSTSSGRRPDPPLEVSLPQMKAARDDVKATHLSPDGKFAYCERYGEALQAEWDGAKYESWWPVVGGKMPENAVRL